MHVKLALPFWFHGLLATCSLLLAVVPGLALAQDVAVKPRPGTLSFVPYEVTDSNYGGMRVATLLIPAGWGASSQVRWDYTSANYPLHVYVHIQSPDAKMWIDILPMDVVYWMDRMGQSTPIGQRAFGAVYAPNLGIEQAMQRLVVQPARGNMPGFQITSKRPVDPARMAAAFNLPDLRGEAMTMHVRYTKNGAPADEDFFTFYRAAETLSYTGPQGTGHEYHRRLMLSHSVGAIDGLLPSAYPLLATIVGSTRSDEAYQRHVQAVKAHITAQHAAAMKRGYDSIAAAGQLSRSISAKNDALLASMQRQRAAQNRADSTRRAAEQGSSSVDGFSQYLRGTTRMADPYWGTSERDSNFSQHWTDGQGNYRASNDASFNPNVGAGGGATWQRMETR